MEKLLLFQIRNRQFGIDLPLIKNIYKADMLFQGKESGHSLKQIRHIVSIDGEEIPLYDLSFLVSQEGSYLNNEPEGKKIMIVNLQRNRVGFKVDRVDQVVSVTRDRIELLPSVFGIQSQRCFPRVLKQEDKLILLLNPKGIEEIEPEDVLLKHFIPDSEPSFSESRVSIADSPMINGDLSLSVTPVSPEKFSLSKDSEPDKRFLFDELKWIALQILKKINEFGKALDYIEPDKLENLLLRIFQEKKMIEIMEHCIDYLSEKAVSRQIKKVKKILHENAEY